MDEKPTQRLAGMSGPAINCDMGASGSVSITVRYISWLPQASKRSPVQINPDIDKLSDIQTAYVPRFLLWANLGSGGLPVGC
jgi:hypothetical protein